MQADNNPIQQQLSEETKGPPKACLFVASLTNFTTEEELRNLFGEHGEILKIKLLKDHVSRPYAFVQFSDVDDASKAIENTKDIILNNRRLRVERARVNRTLFVAKLSKQMESHELKEIMEEYGPVESVTIIKNHQTNRSKGCGFVKFEFREDAVLALSDVKNSQSKWVVEWATSNNDPESLRIDKNNIFVGGLNPQEITEEKITERFSVYGEMESLTLVNRENNSDEQDGESNSNSAASMYDDPSRMQRNAFAFIRYVDEASSAKAIEEENGEDWLGKRIRVQYCESKEMKNKRRAKQMKYAQYNYGHYYPGMPMMYIPDGDMQNNLYNYYPMYYNSAPWIPYQQVPMDGTQPMIPMYGQEEMVGYGSMPPSVVPHLPWLP